MKSVIARPDPKFDLVVVPFHWFVPVPVRGAYVLWFVVPRTAAENLSAHALYYTFFIHPPKSLPISTISFDEYSYCLILRRFKSLQSLR